MAEVVNSWDETPAASTPPAVSSWDQAAPTVDSWDQPLVSKAGFKRAAIDIGQVYPLAEAALHAGTAAIFGFPAYLGGGLGQIFNRAIGTSNELPSDVANRFAQAVTYQPQTEAGKRVTESAMLPLTKLMEWGEKGGHAVTDKTGSPLAGALTESTIQMAPALLGAPIRRAHEATMPKYTGREGAVPPPPDLSTGLSTAFEGINPPPITGTSSGVPLKLDKLIAGAARDWQLPQPPNVKGEIRDIKKAGPQPGQAGLPLEPRPGIEQTIESAKGDITAPPEAPQARSAPPVQPATPPEASFTPFNVDKDYGAPPLAIPDSEVRGSRSGGADRKVYEIVHFNTPFERVLADSGRNWQSDSAKANARERLNAAVRQMSDADAQRFGAFKDMTPEQATEAAKQYFDQIRSQLFAARKAKPTANAVQIEAPDAERALLRQPEPPAAPAEPGIIPPPPLDLSPQTPADLATKAAREGDQATAQRERLKRESEAGAGAFQLAGDEKPPAVAEAQARAAQGDLLETPPAAAPKPKATAPKSLLGSIMDLGGIDKAELLDLTGENKAGRRKGIPTKLFRDDGRGLDDLATSLRERGFNIPDDPVDGGVQALRDMIRDEVDGRQKHYPSVNEEAQFAKMARDRQRGGPDTSLDEGVPMSDAEAEKFFGPGTLSMNPMMNPQAIKDFLDRAIKKGFGWANAIQSAPESAKGAIAPLIEYARKVQAAKEIAQRDVIDPAGRAQAIAADHARALNDVYRVNPRFQYRKPANIKEMVSETERMQRETAAGVLRRKLREDGYAIKGHDAVPEKGEVFREPKLNMTALKDESGRSLRLREDVQDVVDQVVGAHDIGEQRRYNKSAWGKLEAVNHATVGWLMQNPIFHMVTTAGKAAVYTIPSATRRSLAQFWGSATEAINDRAQLRDWVEHGFQPFPLRAKMEITGATPGVIESLFSKTKTAKGAYEVYQQFHNRILADVVNKIQMSFAQMRLEQLVKQARARGEVITPEKIDAFKTTAAQESNPVGGNLPREELNRTLYRVTGNLFFSRGLQVSTTRFLTRTIENNEIVRSYAESKGFSTKEAQILTDRNRNFLMTALALDYLLMQTVANAINYTTTSLYDQPDKDGNKGGHFVWENPGAKPEDKFFPTRIYLYPKTGEDGKPTGESVYISNPIRTVRDIIEYAMVPFQIGSGTKPKILENKSSVTAHFAKDLLTGTDWAGRPLSGPGDVAAETGSMLMPSPAGDLPRYALESYRSGNTSFLAEGLKKIFDPEIAIPVLLGLQPSTSSKSPDVTMKAGEVSKDQAKVWARASRAKQLMRGMSPETRDAQIESVLNDAEKAGMDARTIKGISRFLQNEDVSKSQQRKAETYDMLHAPTDELAPPPKELERVD